MMKHFIVILTLKAPPGQISESLLLEHESYFQTGCDLGLFLFSGRRVARGGFVALARAESPSTLEDFLREDPLWLNRLVSLAILEIKPTSYPPSLRAWVEPLRLRERLGNADETGMFI